MPEQQPPTPGRCPAGGPGPEPPGPSRAGGRGGRVPPPGRPAPVRAFIAAVLLLPFVSCAPEPGASGGELLVSAASSLTDVFGELEAAFERDHPGVDVVLNLAGSSGLREQILEGAPVDVYAPADLRNMERVVRAGRTAGSPRLFARNRLVIAVPAGNPAGVTGLEAFADGERLIGLCAPEVPCGDLARQALERAGVEPSVDTNESSARALLGRIALGELDAGLLYVTDLEAASGRVEGVELPEPFQVATAYPVAALADAPNPTAAAAFVDFLLGRSGRAVLLRHGFLLP